MTRQIVVNPKKCLGCGTCEQVCSLVKTGTLDTEHSAIKVIVYDDEEFAVPLMCHQCDEAPCVKICPVGALYRGNDNVVSCDEGKCIVCRLCADACPIGNLSYSALIRKMIKCNRCEGDPKCVSFCPTNAISYSTDDIGLEHRRTIAETIKNVYQTDLNNEYMRICDNSSDK